MECPGKHNDPNSQRKVRSFVLRQGRITPAQERAFDEHWLRYGLEFQGCLQDFSSIFARRAPLVMEIGFGNGEQLLHSACAEPDKNFIGIEVHRPGVGRLMNALDNEKIRNVRVYNHDAVEVLEHEIPSAILSEARIYFPDPWPKKRHHKRRLIQKDFLALLATRMTPHGLLHLATDWEEYAEHMIEILHSTPQWRNCAPTGDSVTCPPWRIATHFEKRGMRLGHGVWDLVYERI